MSRRAWVYVTTGYVVMAIGFIVFGFLLQHQVNRIDDTQSQIKSTQRQLATVAVHNAGAICLGLTAPTKEQEMAIIEAFLKGDGTIIAQFTPTCARVGKRAATDIFGDNLPPELQAELDQVLTP